MHFQPTGLGVPKLSRLVYAFLAFWTFETFWMKMFEYPLNAIFIVKQLCDWKFHARSLPLHGTSFTYEPKRSMRLPVVSTILRMLAWK
jgi:hypothetical protein